MRLTVPKLQDNPRNIIRRCGYAEFRDPRTGETSYVRRLSNNFYPRFHIYLETKGEGVVVDLHLDQKKPSYEGFSAHNGEYDGEVVEREMERIKIVVIPA